MRRQRSDGQSDFIQALTHRTAFVGTAPVVHTLFYHIVVHILAELGDKHAEAVVYAGLAGYYLADAEASYFVLLTIRDLKVITKTEVALPYYIIVEYL